MSKYYYYIFSHDNITFNNFISNYKIYYGPTKLKKKNHVPYMLHLIGIYHSLPWRCVKT